jgi:hypothetical protein
MTPRVQSLVLACLFFCCIPNFVGSLAQVEEAAPGLPLASLCDLLSQASRGSRIPARVYGTLVSGFELSILYDEVNPECPLDIQPSTWVEFSPGMVGAEKLDLDGDFDGLRATRVELRGELWGLPALEPDEKRYQSMPIFGAFSIRKGYQRYGHLGGFRTKFMVDEVLAVHSAHMRTDGSKFVKFRREGMDPNRLEVVRAEIPQYPPLARRADLEGDVLVKLRVADGEVVEKIILTGDSLFHETVLENVETWRFPMEDAGELLSTFRFRLVLKHRGAGHMSTVELQLPYSVTVVGAADGW